MTFRAMARNPGRWWKSQVAALSVPALMSSVSYAQPELKSGPVDAPDSPTAKAVPPGFWEARFLRGYTTGDPSPAKRTTLYSLYGLSGIALGFSAVFGYEYFRAGDLVDDYNREGGPCADRSGDRCDQWIGLREHEDTALLLSMSGLALSAASLVGGVWLAHSWENVKPELAVGPEGGHVGLRLHF